MSNFDDFLKEQLKSEEFRREYEALEPDYELVLRGDVDPRNLCYLIHVDGTEYNDYERGYNDGVIAAYELTRQARKIEAEPIVHAHWEPTEILGMVQCSKCGFPDIQHEFRLRCSHCGARMDEKVELRTCYCPFCDKHFEVRTDDRQGSCPGCGRHVVLHRVEVDE